MTDGLGLGDAYSATLSRIKGQGGEKARLGMAALMWISHSERPFRANELCHALAVEVGSSNLNSDNVPSIGTLLACCQGLVAVDKETSTVRLIHFTLQEHLRAQPELFVTAHSTMAETCLSYLNSHQVKALSASLSSDPLYTPFLNYFPQDMPFLEYSSLYWGTHARRDPSDCAKVLALQLFGDYNNHISAKILLDKQWRYSFFVDFNKPSLFTGLHCASLFGIVEIVDSLVEVEGYNINQEDCVGNTPLLWAVSGRHEGVVKVLLERDGVDPNKTNNGGQTPLSCAARNGYEGVMKVLFERDDIDPNKPDNEGQTPLGRAAFSGHEGVVKILLGRADISPDKLDNNGWAPLSWAAFSGHEEVVKILLERDDVCPDGLDNSMVPLCCAAWRGHGGVAKMLLERADANPNKLDTDGQTPLCCAAEEGHEGVVKMLLERDDVNPDKPDAGGRTPLWSAAKNGHKGVVEILLERRDVDPDKPDNDGQIPLSCAASNGHEGVVQMLIGRHNVNPDKPDNGGEASL